MLSEEEQKDFQLRVMGTGSSQDELTVLAHHAGIKQLEGKVI